MAGRPGTDIFQAIGQVAGGVARQELSDLQQLRRQEEALTTIELSNQFDTDNTNWLIDKDENYTYDGNLTADAERYFNERENTLINGLQSKNVQRLTKGALAKSKSDFLNKAQALEATKHLDYQKTLWSTAEQNAASKIQANNGDINILQEQIAIFETNKEDYTDPVRQKLLPETKGKLSKLSLDSRINYLELRMAKGELSPEEALTDIEIYEQSILRQASVYGLIPDDVRIYNDKVVTFKKSLLTKGAKAYKNSINTQVESFENLINNGQESPYNPNYLALKQQQIALDPEKAAERSKDYAVLVGNYNATTLASNGDIEELTQYQNELQQQYRSSKGQVSPVQEDILFTNYTVAQEKLREANKLIRTNQGELFKDSETAKSVLRQEGYVGYFNWAAAKSSEYAPLHNFRPLTPNMIEDIGLQIQSVAASGDFRLLRETMTSLVDTFDEPVMAYGNVSGAKILKDNLLHHFAQKASSNKADKDPFSLDDKYTMLLPYSKELSPFEFDQSIRYLSAETPLLDKDVREKNAIQEGITKEIIPFLKARSGRSDVLFPPELALQPLLTEIAYGHYELSKKRNAKDSAKWVVETFLKRDTKVVNTGMGETVVSKDISKEVLLVLQSRQGTGNFALEELAKKNPDVEFASVYTIEGYDISRKVFNAAIGNNSQLVDVGNNEYQLYVGFQDQRYPLLEKNTKTPIVFKKEEVEKYAKVLRSYENVYDYYGKLPGIGKPSRSLK
jgi:hypothetical protein